MPRRSPAPVHDPARRRIAERVRELRLARGWTQAELARRLHLSQNRLSEIERGGGSFSAEQFLEVLRLFNVDVGTFDVRGRGDGAVQNALLRFGAAHLRQDPDAPLTERYRSPTEVVAAVLLQPTSERHVAALAPVLVWSVEEVSLPAAQRELAQAGVPNRLHWLAENTLAALLTFQPGAARDWNLRARRARVVLASFVDGSLRLPLEAPTLDLFDPSVRSDGTRDRVWRDASEISKRWWILSDLQVSDFASALEAARDAVR